MQWQEKLASPVYDFSHRQVYNPSQRMISPVYTEMQAVDNMMIGLDEDQMITAMQIVVASIEFAAVDEAGGEDGS